MEEKLKEMSSVRLNVAHVQNLVFDIEEHAKQLKEQMNSYEESINYYNNQHDDIVVKQSNKDKIIEQLHVCKDMEELQSSYKTFQNNQTATESKLIALQCRSMCEN